MIVAIKRSSAHYDEAALLAGRRFSWTLNPSCWSSLTARRFSPFGVTARPRIPASAQHLHPPGDGSADLVRRIFLHIMTPRDGHLGQRWQVPDKCEILVIGEDRTRLGPEEQLGHTAR